jgi:hypothetical protein
LIKKEFNAILLNHRVIGTGLVKTEIVLKLEHPPPQWQRASAIFHTFV